MLMRNILLISVLAILLLGCVSGPPQANNTTYKPPVLTGQNNTTLKPGLPPGYSVSLGDNVTVWYALWVNNTLYDTNNESLARQEGTYSPAKKYLPLQFTAQLDKNIVNGFVLGVVGMKINETIYFNVDPARGYGPYDPKKVIVIPRYYNKSLMETVPISFFTDKGMNVSEGESFNTQYGTVFVQNLTDGNVTLFYLLSPGQNLTVNGIPQRVVELDNLTAKMEFALEENRSYNLPNPDTGAKMTYKVIGKTDQNITLDYNHPLANETLRFRVTLIDAVPAKQ